MKVGTDSVLLGAWVSKSDYTSILDIGCGSGLISLMLAQRFAAAKIFGVEIDAAACLDASLNFEESPWANRLKVEHADIRGLEISCKYDLIISNPPFFSESLLPNEKARAEARHDHSLRLSDLFESANIGMADNGVFALVYPFERQEEVLEVAAQNEFFPQRILQTRNRPDADIKRSFIEFRKEKLENVIFESLSIRNSDHVYSEDYKGLTSEFYLKF
jgi:tRNA1Val (adenine37-N6)-methyltransferase